MSRTSRHQASARSGPAARSLPREPREISRGTHARLSPPQDRSGAVHDGSAVCGSVGGVRGEEDGAVKETSNQGKESGEMKKHRTSNTEHRTSNQGAYDGGRRFDLEDRLLEFSARIIELVDSLKATRSANHIGGQLLRSGTSPYLHHGEVESAESRADFIHKLKVCL